MSDSGIFWKELSLDTNKSKDIFCRGKDDGSMTTTFNVKAICTESEEFGVPNKQISSCQVPRYLIKILPALVFDNKLAFVVDLTVAQCNYQMRIEPGERINLHCVYCGGETEMTLKVN